jgi:DNA-binding transcriptional regulator YiaG
MLTTKEQTVKTTKGEEIVRRLQAFTKALKEKNTDEYTCQTVTLNLKPTPYGRKQVKETRKVLRASQSVFARVLGVSVKTVRAWEQGFNTPSDMACRFMDEIRAKPEYWRSRMRDYCTPKEPA